MKTLPIKDDHLAEVQAIILGCIELNDTLQKLVLEQEKLQGMVRWYEQAIEDIQLCAKPSDAEIQERLLIVQLKKKEIHKKEVEINTKKKELELLQEALTFRMAVWYDLDPLRDQWHIDTVRKTLTCQDKD